MHSQHAHTRHIYMNLKCITLLVAIKNKLNNDNFLLAIFFSREIKGLKNRRIHNKNIFLNEIYILKSKRRNEHAEKNILATKGNEKGYEFFSVGVNSKALISNNVGRLEK